MMPYWYHRTVIPAVYIYSAGDANIRLWWFEPQAHETQLLK